MDTQVLGISVDSPFANQAYAKQLGLTFPLLSDFKREVVRKYGIFMEDSNVAYRTTLVIDKSGIIQSIEQGSQAIDINGAASACSKIHAPKP
jgi:glutaredoxin-dependent peroxiredoxin